MACKVIVVGNMVKDALDNLEHDGGEVVGRKSVLVIRRFRMEGPSLNG